MRTFIRNLFLICIIAVSMQGCNDEGYSLGDFHVSYATIVRESSSTYTLRLDSGEKLWIGAGYLNYPGVEGQRVIADFTLLGDEYEGYDHIVKVNNLYEILTKPIEEINTEEEDIEFGNDGLPSINKMWLGGGYLNVKFTHILPIKELHRVSIVQNKLIEYPDDEYIYLEFRYNTYNDLSDYILNSIASFNLNNIDLKEKKGLKISWLDHKNVEHIEELELTNISVLPEKDKKLDNANLF